MPGSLSPTAPPIGPEGVEAGMVRLIGIEPDVIAEQVRAELHDRAVRQTMARSRDLMGDGRASLRAVAATAHRRGLGDRPDDFELCTSPDPR